MRRLLTLAATADEPKDCRNTRNGNERGHPKQIDAEERGKAQGIVDERG